MPDTHKLVASYLLTITSWTTGIVARHVSGSWFVSHSFAFSYFFSFTNKIHTSNHSSSYFSKSYLCILPLIDSRQRIKQLYLHSAAAHGMAFGACSLRLFIQKVFSGPPSRSLLTPRDGIQSQALIIWCITKRLRNCKQRPVETREGSLYFCGLAFGLRQEAEEVSISYL